MCSHNPITELLNEIKHTTKNTNLTIQSVLNVAQYLFYRTHGRINSLKILSREKLKPLVSKYRINPQDTAPSFFIAKNKPEVQPREIHIWEFPPNFWVQLEPNKMEGLMNHAAETIGGLKQLARILKIHVDTIYGYRACRTFIPLASLLKLCDCASDEFSIEQVEPHVVAYKGGSTAKPILNPYLPLVETPSLFALMGHLAGDGGHSKCQASYANTQEALIRKFLRLLHVVFGDVPVCIRKPDNTTRVIFGLTIIRLLRHVYHIDFRTFTARVPHHLFELPKEYAAAFLQAFGDDEGGVSDAGITLNSANKKLMQDIYYLVQAKFPELEEYAVLEEAKSLFYAIRFRIGAFGSYRTFIGFTHPKKKQELDHILARRVRGWEQRNKGTSRRMLLEVLRSRPMTTKALARQLEVTTGVVRGKYLKDLIEWGFIRVRGKKPGSGGAKLFDLTEKGHIFLQLPSIGLISGWYGQTKLEILKKLAKGSLTAKELGQKLGLKKAAIWEQLRGRKRRGLVELGLVRRSGEGGKTDPYVYCLTDTGRRFLETLDTLFPELDKSS